MKTITRIAALGLVMLLLPSLIAWCSGGLEEDLPVSLDVEIRDSVEEWLDSQDRFDDTEIFVSVIDGEVILEGEVPSYALKQRAELEARNIPGVTSVQNELDVGVDVGDVGQLLADRSLKGGNLLVGLGQRHVGRYLDVYVYKELTAHLVGVDVVGAHAQPVGDGAHGLRQALPHLTYRVHVDHHVSTLDQVSDLMLY